MEREGSLPFSQESATLPYTEPDESDYTLPPYFPKIQYDIVFPSTPGFSE
jgi:hypothetical protein